MFVPIIIQCTCNTLIKIYSKSFRLHNIFQVSEWCYNPSLGLATKAKACKDAGQN